MKRIPGALPSRRGTGGRSAFPRRTVGTRKEDASLSPAATPSLSPCLTSPRPVTMDAGASHSLRGGRLMSARLSPLRRVTALLILGAVLGVVAAAPGGPPGEKADKK